MLECFFRKQNSWVQDYKDYGFKEKPNIAFSLAHTEELKSAQATD